MSQAGGNWVKNGSNYTNKTILLENWSRFTAFFKAPFSQKLIFYLIISPKIRKIIGPLIKVSRVSEFGEKTPEYFCDVTGQLKKNNTDKKKY